MLQKDDLTPMCTSPYKFKTKWGIVYEEFLIKPPKFIKWETNNLIYNEIK